MKDCLIIGPVNSRYCESTYGLLRDKVLKIGIYQVGWEGEERCWAIWLTTLNVNKPENKIMRLTRTYQENDYPTYDNYDAIESRSKDIPTDYYGKIGVPVSFLRYYPELDYEILEKRNDLQLNGKKLFTRLIIRRKGE